MGSDDWLMTFVGTGSLLSGTYRAFPATLLEAFGLSYLFDCGDGTVSRLRQLNKTGVDVLAVTTVSSSELGGLLMLGEVHRRSRNRALRVFGPPGLKRALEALSVVSSLTLVELFDIDEVGPGEVIHEHEGQYLEAIAVDVGDDACGYGYMLYESPLPGRVDGEKARHMGITGGDFGRLFAGQTVRGVRPFDLIGPPRQGRRVVVSARGRPTDYFEAALQGSDVAVFAAPFMDDRLEVAEDAKYLTGWEAAQLATRAKVRMAVIQCIGPSAPARFHLAEARQFHNNLIAPDDGDVLYIPVPDRGTPHLERNHKRSSEQRQSQSSGTVSRKIGR